MRMTIKRITVTLMVLSSTACGSGRVGEVQDNQSVDHSLFPSTVTLAVEETATVGGDLSIRLDRLEDQLCPCLPDLLCVWEGFAEADLALMDKDAELGVVMLEVGGRPHTREALENARTGIIGDFLLRLDEVLPGSSCDDPYADPGVVITVSVE